MAATCCLPADNYDPTAEAAQDRMGRTYRYLNLTSQAPLVHAFKLSQNKDSRRLD